MPAQTPPSSTTPTEPRNYGSYSNQVQMLHKIIWGTGIIYNGVQMFIHLTRSY